MTMYGFEKTEKVKTTQGEFTLKKLNGLEHFEAMDVSTQGGILNMIRYGWNVMMRSIISIPEGIGQLPPLCEDKTKTLKEKIDFLGPRLTPEAAGTLQDAAIKLLKDDQAVTEEDKKKSLNSSSNPNNGSFENKNASTTPSS